jgi:hypothetical protein
MVNSFQPPCSPGSILLNLGSALGPHDLPTVVNDITPIATSAPDDLKWLLDRADKLASDRHNAIHAPCSLYPRGHGSSEVMAAVRSANAGNRRAKDFEGKELLTEFHWCAAYALRLGQFAGMLAPATASRARYEWPVRPKFHLERTSRK